MERYGQVRAEVADHLSDTAIVRFLKAETGHSPTRLERFLTCGRSMPIGNARGEPCRSRKCHGERRYRVGGGCIWACRGEPTLRSMVIEVKGGKNASTADVRSLHGVLDTDTAPLVGLTIEAAPGAAFPADNGRGGQLRHSRVPYPRIWGLPVSGILDGKRFQTPGIMSRSVARPSRGHTPITDYLEFFNFLPFHRTGSNSVSGLYYQVRDGNCEKSGCLSYSYSVTGTRISLSTPADQADRQPQAARTDQMKG